MAIQSRVKKSLLNARVNLIFYVLVLFITFFSRRLFLEKLGNEFIGMTSTLANLLGLLNLAELGVGTAVGYMLYKPLVKQEYEKTNEILSVFSFIYKCIGYVIIIAAFVLGLFLPIIFSKAPFSLSLIYFAYSSYIISALFSYFVNYRQLLLAADQCAYVVTAYYQTANILRLVVQMLVLYKTNNPYYWIALEILFSGIYSIILNHRINRFYPWLKVSRRNGKFLLKKYPQLLRYTKQIFVHQLAGTVLFNLSPVFIYTYTSLTMVAYYTNYVIIFEKLRQLVAQLLGSADAGIGQLVAEGNRDKSFDVFNELFAVRYFVAGVVIAGLWYAITPFIVLWLGKEYLLSDLTLLILLINFFLLLTRSTVDSFISAYGLFYDVWAPLTEAILNVGISIVGGIWFGLNGVLLGSTFSMLLIIGIWKPYFLFRKGLEKPVWCYWRNLFGKVLLIVIGGGIIEIVKKTFITMDPTRDYLSWFLYAFIITSSYAIVLFGLMCCFTHSMRSFVKRFIRF